MCHGSTNEKGQHCARAAARLIFVAVAIACGGHDHVHPAVVRGPAKTTPVRATPNSFAGIKFGESLDALAQRNEVRDCVQVSDGSFACTKDLSLATDVNVAITLSGSEADRKFVRAWFDFESARYDLIEGAFIEKYGEPTRKLSRTEHNAMGAQFDNEMVVWEWAGVIASVMRYGDKVTEGRAFIGVPFPDRSEEEKKAAAEKL